MRTAVLSVPIWVKLFAKIIGRRHKLVAATKSAVSGNCSCEDPERRQGPGPPPPPEKSHYIGFLSNASQDPLKNHKTTKQALNVGPPFSGIGSPHQLKQKNVGKVGPPLTKLSGSAHAVGVKSACLNAVHGLDVHVLIQILHFVLFLDLIIWLV